jgi:hypothetical protein
MVQINLAPAVVDVAGIRAGDRNLFQVTVRSGGSALNLTGYTITAQARDTAADEANILDAVCTVTDATTGKIDVRWPGDDVRTWLGSSSTLKGVWDMQLDDGTNDPWTVIAGSFSAELDVTRV